MHFPRIRLVEQTEQKFRRLESVLKKEKKLVTVIVGLSYYEKRRLKTIGKCPKTGVCGR